jgi:hypothetical protein
MNNNKFSSLKTGFARQQTFKHLLLLCQYRKQSAYVCIDYVLYVLSTQIYLDILDWMKRRKVCLFFLLSNAQP